MPYDEEARVTYQGRSIVETIAPGAFAGVTSPVKVNMAHDYERPIGRVAKFHPNDPRGLRTELRVVNTRTGDDVLEPGGRGPPPARRSASCPAGRRAVPTEGRTRRRITRAMLDHIALTGDPAYLGAKVLAVRAAGGDERPARVETPNLDRIRLERLAAGAGMAAAPASRDSVTSEA